MDRLIVICRDDIQADNLAFLLGIPTTSVLPYYNKECIELINPDAVGGFLAIPKPYTDNVIELRDSLKSHPVLGNKLINLHIDENGDCEVLRLITEDIKRIFAKYSETNADQYRIMSITSELRRMFDHCGLRIDNGFDFRIVDSMVNTKLYLKPNTKPFELFLKLIEKYRTNNQSASIN